MNGSVSPAVVNANADLIFGIEDLGGLIYGEVIVFTEYGDTRHFGKVRFRNPRIATNLPDCGPSLYWAVSEDGVPQSSSPAAQGLLNQRVRENFRFRPATPAETAGLEFSYEENFTR